MAKRKRYTTEKLRQKRRKEGRGLGYGRDYKPGLTIQDVASIGLATRVRGWKTGRIHQFLSKLEWFLFFLMDWSLRVVDIREQFPLDLDETLAIAQELGIRHPTDPKTKLPIDMTTDFLITVKSDIREITFARTVKYVEKLASRRVMEKFEIERVYWTRRGVDWGIVTERDVPRELVENIRWVHYHKDVNSLAPTPESTIKAVETYLTPVLTAGQKAMRDCTENSDQQFLLQPGTSLAIVRHLIANRRFEVDMNTVVRPEKVVPVRVRQVDTNE